MIFKVFDPGDPSAGPQNHWNSIVEQCFLNITFQVAYRVYIRHIELFWNHDFGNTKIHTKLTIFVAQINEFHRFSMNPIDFLARGHGNHGNQAKTAIFTPNSMVSGWYSDGNLGFTKEIPNLRVNIAASPQIHWFPMFQGPRKTCPERYVYKGKLHGVARGQQKSWKSSKNSYIHS